MTTADSIEVIVKEAARDDAGRGIARLAIEAMRTLGVVSGDAIEIQERRRPPQSSGRDSPRTQDSHTFADRRTVRSNAGTGVDERVRVRKVEVGYAKKVVIHPTQPIRLVGGEQHLRGGCSGAVQLWKARRSVWMSSATLLPS